MIIINSNKVAGFRPEWKEMRGFSLIFDMPEALDRYFLPGSASALPALFHRLYSAFDAEEWMALTNLFLLCPLPPSSYHVTVLDGVNDSVFNAISPVFRPVFLSYLSNINNDVTLPPPFSHLFDQSLLLIRKDWNLNFHFKNLAIWEKSQALVVQLVAADEPSEIQVSLIMSERDRLYAKLDELLGVSWSRPWKPHITLGYFANPESATMAKAYLPVWEEKIRNAAGVTAITFQSISLFGFDKMSNFFKQAMPERLPPP